MSTITSTVPVMQTDSDSVEAIRNSFTALRLSFTWFGVRRSLSPDQCEQAAAQFGAERAYISASKKLIDAAHPAMRTVNQIRREVSEYWRDNSLPFPKAVSGWFDSRTWCNSMTTLATIKGVWLMRSEFLSLTTLRSNAWLASD